MYVLGRKRSNFGILSNLRRIRSIYDLETGFIIEIPHF